MPEDQTGPEVTDKAPAQPQITAGDVGKGCLGIIVIGFIGLFLFAWIGGGTDYKAVATTQVAAITLSVLEDTNGAKTISDLIQEKPEDGREEHARQIVDYWFNTDGPARYPTTGVDADWLERDSARRIVKRKMVEIIIANAESP